MEKTLAYLSIVLALLLGSFFGYWLRGEGPGTIEYQTDTLWRYDTVRIPQPVPVNKWIHDTTYIAITDTALIHHHDTTFVPIPRETTLYRDETFEAWVTGFRSTLDSIHVFQKTAIVEVPVVKTVSKRWGIGVQAGATYLPKQGITPYVGVGVSYNLLTF